MIKKSYAIYRIHNIETNTDYIGWSLDPINRVFEQHEKNSSYIGNAICTYGWDVFDVDVLHLVKTKKEVLKLEVEEIAKHNCQAPNGYNLTPGGDDPPSQKGHRWKWLKESCEKIKGNKNPAKKPGVGAKISAAKKGKERPDVSERNKDNKYGVGRIYTPSKISGVKRSITCLKKAIKKLEQELDK